jgi:hypothetical protein
MTCVSISFMGSGFGTFIGCGGDGTVHRKNYIQQLDHITFKKVASFFVLQQLFSYVLSLFVFPYPHE